VQFLRPEFLFYPNYVVFVVGFPYICGGKPSKQNTAMKTLLDTINENIDNFQANATSQIEKANKAAGTRARKVSLDLEKKLKEFRKKSIEWQNKI
jgi:hypothetical protein